jgi:hypothetical protein
VRESHEDPVRSGAAPEDPPVEDLVAALVARTRRDRAERIEGVTGEDGRCGLNGLADLPYRVSAYAEGWSFRPVTPYHAVRDGAEVGFRGTPRGHVSLTVLLPDGTEPEWARIEFSGRPYGGWRRWTPGRRDAWPAPGTYSVSAIAGEASEFRSAPVEIAVPPEGLGDPIVLRLDPRTGIRGRVVLPDGDLGAPGRLRALRLVEGEDAEAARFLDDQQTQEVKVAADGKFTILDLEPGEWLVGLVTGREAIGRTLVRVESGLADCEVVLPEPDPTESAIVTVKGPDGKREIRLSVVSELSAGEMRWAGPPGVPLESGDFRVVHARPKEGEMAEGGAWTLRLWSREYGEVRVPYGGPSERRVEVTLEEPARLTVTLTGYAAGEDAGHVKLILVPAEGAGQGPYWRTDKEPDPAGRWTADALAPGDYRIVVQILPDKRARIPAVVREVGVYAGENKVEIPMPRLYTLSILSDVPSSSFALRPPRESRQRWHVGGRTPKDGRVVFTHLPAGDYLVEPSGPARRPMYATLPGTSELTYDPRPDNCLIIRITDESGVFARAGLREGDVVVAIDGTDLTDARQMQALGTLAMKKREATLTILRGGQRVEVKADLSDYRSWGARFEATRR